MGKVALTPAKSGMKSGAKQTTANKFFKNKGDSAQRFAKKVPSGKSGLPSPVTAKGKNVFKSEVQESAFTNPKGVMSHNAGACKFVA